MVNAGFPSQLAHGFEFVDDDPVDFERRHQSKIYELSDGPNQS